jgi:hypothetical protein
MTEPTKATETTSTDAVAKDEVKEVLETTEASVDSQKESSLMDEATAEEKEAQAVEEKRLLEAKDEDLSDEDKVKKTELTKAKEETAKAKEVPEKYEFIVPEGMVLDQEYADKASVILKKHGITQAAATELGTMAAEQIKKVIAEQGKQSEANFNSFVEDLKKETISELSKEGKDYKKELSFAAKSRDRFASPGLIDKLNKSGLANDIDVIRHFINIGKSISEGKLVEGKSDGMGETNPLDILYPKTVKK